MAENYPPRVSFDERSPQVIGSTTQIPTPSIRRTIFSGDSFDQPSANASTSSSAAQRTVDPEGPPKKVAFEFKGLMAPVLTCFRADDSFDLELRFVERYARWLKSHNISGVMINGIPGEGPAMSLAERKEHTEAWWHAAKSVGLVLMVQIGGAPLPDVWELAEQAEGLDVDAVLCLPDLTYKPQTEVQLINYCKCVAKHCPTRPFFYYHIPKYTNVRLNMETFCRRADDKIPSFHGVHFSCPDIEAAGQCINDKRIIFLGAETQLLNGVMMGFEAMMMDFFNIRPDLAADIMAAVRNGHYEIARDKQREVNDIVQNIMRTNQDSWEGGLKLYFNQGLLDDVRAGFPAGPFRHFY